MTIKQLENELQGLKDIRERLKDELSIVDLDITQLEHEIDITRYNLYNNTHVRSESRSSRTNHLRN